MTRQSRMAIILVAIALVGVVSLALLARRYSEAVSRDGTAPPAAAAESAGTVDPAGMMEGFLAGRRAVLAVLDSDLEMKDSLCDEVRGDTEGRDRVKMYIAAVANIRTDRAVALKEAGMSEDEYFAVRERYRKWKAGDPSLEAEWAATFDANRERLDPIDLGDCEAIDY